MVVLADRDFIVDVLLSSPSCATCVVCLLGDEDVFGTGDGQLCCIGCGRQYHIQWCQGTSVEKGLKMCGTIFFVEGVCEEVTNIMRLSSLGGVSGPDPTREVAPLP